MLSKIRVDEDGIKFRIYYIGFNEISRIKLGWGGRLMTYGKKLDLGYILLNPKKFVEAVKVVKPEALAERIFNYASTPSLRRSFEKQRKRIAFKLGNHRILKITFKTFRHWKATTEYNKTKDILYVMQVLGHKNIKNTLRYTQLVNFAQDEYVCKVATTVKQASELIEVGYEYVCEIEGAKLFRKRK